MSPGDLKLKDPSSIKNAQFDWSAYLAAGVTIVTPTITVTGPDAVLATASVALDVTSQKVNYKISGGTVGWLYTVTSRIVTNETPAQTDDRSIQVRIQNL